MGRKKKKKKKKRKDKPETREIKRKHGVTASRPVSPRPRVSKEVSSQNNPYRLCIVLSVPSNEFQPEGNFLDFLSFFLSRYFFRVTAQTVALGIVVVYIGPSVFLILQK